MLALPLIELAGTPTEMGRAHGTALAERIRAFVDQRLRAARAYLWEQGRRDAGDLLARGRDCLAALAAWDADGHAEHVATAAAAGVDAVELFTAANMTDVRDLLLLRGGPAAEVEGCSTALVPAAASADGQVIAAQTWDLNPTDLDFVVACHRRPAQGPECWTITCAGCPSLMGMNAHGVAFGTTNIKVRGCRVGVPYLPILHRMARARDRNEALALVESAPRCAAHTYWAADAGGAGDLECSAERCWRRDAGARPLNRTNHCLDAVHAAHEAEAPSASSRARLARVAGVLEEGGITVAAVRQLFTDRSDGVDSVNRYAEDQQGTTTNACMIAVPARRELHACRGPADRGIWVKLAFASV
jgi:isopenicillin-N N-acyltransferase-like protein